MKTIKLTESDLNRIVKKVLTEQDETNYMFFSNLTQMKRQLEMMMEMDPSTVDQILQNEQILNTDIRKVGVTIKKAYTGQVLLQDVSAFYRVYVREGTTEVLVQDWTPINRTPNEYYFIFDMRDKIPNQYYVDIQVNTSGEKDTYKRQLTFNIVNKKQNYTT